jgi:hypothetical protein
MCIPVRVSERGAGARLRIGLFWRCNGSLIYIYIYMYVYMYIYICIYQREGSGARLRERWRACARMCCHLGRGHGDPTKTIVNEDNKCRTESGTTCVARWHTCGVT